MERLLLAIMILAVGLVVLLTGKIMPQYSSVILLLVFMVLYAWLLTLALVHQKRMALKYPKPLNTDYKPKVSIVIAAHNEEIVIENTIKTLMRLDYPDFELLVMDDRSTDRTPGILQRMKDAHPEWGERFRYHVRHAEATPGKPAVLNESLTMTDGPVVCVFDADAFVEPDFLTRIVPFLSDENVGAVQARKIIANSEINLLTHCQNYEYSLDAHFQTGRDSVSGAVELRGNGQLVKRIALEEVNGWNERTLTDDLDLSTRLHLAGWDIRFAHKVPVFEEGITTFNALLRQRRRWTEGTLVRYLEYAGPLLHSRKVSFRATLDMVAYFLEFLLPLWIAFDFLQLGLDVLSGDLVRTRVLSSLFIGPMVAVFFSSALVVAIIRFNKKPYWEALRWSIVTGMYMTFIWLPLVFAIMVKVLFQKQRRLRWDKTEHTGAAHQTMGTA